MSKVFSLAEISKHNTNKDCWLLINGKVYNVTKFLEEHPGGDEVLLSATGRDATAEFEDVGHSSSAKSLMQGFYVGDFESNTTEEDHAVYGGGVSVSDKKLNQEKSSQFMINFLKVLVPLIILGFGIVFRNSSAWFNKQKLF